MHLNTGVMNLVAAFVCVWCVCVVVVASLQTTPKSISCDVGITVQSCAISMCTEAREVVNITTNCDDGNKCTDDSCNETTGLCEHVQRVYATSDANQCRILFCIDCTLDYIPEGTCLGYNLSADELPPGVTHDPDVWYMAINGTNDNSLFDDISGCASYTCDNTTGDIEITYKPDGTMCSDAIDLCHSYSCVDGECVQVSDLACSDDVLPTTSGATAYSVYATLCFMSGFAVISLSFVGLWQYVRAHK